MDFSKEMTFREKIDGAAPPETPTTEKTVDNQENPLVPDPGGKDQGTASQKAKRPGKRKEVYPTKTRINLIAGKARKTSRITEISLFLLIVIAVGIFAKFTVIDPLASSVESSRQVTAMQHELDSLRAENESNASIVEDYSKYIIQGLTDEEIGRVDRNSIIKLLEEKLMYVGYLSTVKLTGNTLTVTIADMDLQDLSLLVQNLETDPRVSYVAISTAQGAEKGSSATVTVTVKSGEEKTAQSSSHSSEQSPQSASSGQPAQTEPSVQGVSSASSENPSEEGAAHG